MRNTELHFTPREAAALRLAVERLTKPASTTGFLHAAPSPSPLRPAFAPRKRPAGRRAASFHAP